TMLFRSHLQHDGRAELRARVVLHARGVLRLPDHGLAGCGDAGHRLLGRAGAVAPAGGRAGRGGRALRPAAGPQVGPRSRAALHLRPDLHHGRGGPDHLGRSTVPYAIPQALEGSLFTLFTTTFPVYRGFMMGVAIFMLVAIWLLLTRTRFGLVIQAALTHPDAVEALGHNVPRVFMLTFGGGCALAGLAGVIGGNAYVTEPSMGAQLGTILFVVVVVGGMGSLAGAFYASLLIGILQTFAIGLDWSGIDLLAKIGIQVDRDTFGYSVWSLTLPQIALMLPYLLMVLMLIVRPRGLMGTRES